MDRRFDGAEEVATLDGNAGGPVPTGCVVDRSAAVAGALNIEAVSPTAPPAVQPSISTPTT